MRFHRLIAGLGLAVAGCSAGSSGGSGNGTAPVAPGPFLLQYVGGYAGSATGSVGEIVLHVDGTLDATIDGLPALGVFEDTSSSGQASATLRMDSGAFFTASFGADQLQSTAPPRARIELAGRDGTRETLVASWIAGNEGMCDASHGVWHDDDPDPATGLYCVCRHGDVYLPSRGGCVVPRGSADPPRLPPTNAALRRAGIFDGSRRVASITLATSGRYLATIDGRIEEGTWWDATYSPSYDEGAGITVGCTSAWHAFGATLDDGGTLTIRLGSEESETLQRRSQ